MGGGEESSNLVYLTLKEHMVVHRILHFLNLHDHALFGAWLLSRAVYRASVGLPAIRKYPRKPKTFESLVEIIPDSVQTNLIKKIGWSHLNDPKKSQELKLRALERERMKQERRINQLPLIQQARQREFIEQGPKLVAQMTPEERQSAARTFAALRALDCL